MVDIELRMINPTLFFQYLEGSCHGNQFSGKNGTKLPTPRTYRSAIPKRNGIWDITTAICALTAQMMPLYCVKIS